MGKLQVSENRSSTDRRILLIDDFRQMQEERDGQIKQACFEDGRRFSGTKCMETG